MNKERFRTSAQVLLFYTLLVILWGAWVRISHSGDGCGDTWPLCRGQLIPEAEQKKTWVEFGHRLMSGFYGLVVIYLYLASRKLFEKINPTRRFALWTLVFMVTEALLGAKLVLFKLVGTDSSWFRTFAMSLHQINSLLLMGSTTALVLSFNSSGFSNFSFRKLFPREKIFLLGFITIAVTGAWAALAATLFPSLNLWESLQKDFDPTSHFLLRLRLFHPLMALTIGSSLAFLFYRKSQNLEISASFRKVCLQTSAAFVGAMIFGILTLLLLSPLWMKLTHLAIAHLLWVTLIRQMVTSLDSVKR